MKTASIVCGIFIGFSAVMLRAGSLTSFTDSFETNGKLSIKGNLIQAENSSSTERIKLDEVLTGNFSDADFHVDYFSSKASPARLPSDWRGQDVGALNIPGSFSYADGILTISGSGGKAKRDQGDRFHFLARTWAGDGQWAVHVAEIDKQTPAAEAGILLRESFDPGQVLMFGFAAKADASMKYYRSTAGKGPERRALPGQVPIWIRLTRFNGKMMDIEISSDGQIWDLIQQDYIKDFSGTQAGIFFNSFTDKSAGKAVLDQILFTPPPAQPEVVLPGVLLRSGTFLAGRFNGLDISKGEFNRNGKRVPMTTDQVCAATWAPVLRSQIAAVASQPCLIMKNGDSFVSDLVSLDGGGARINSQILGAVTYNSNLMRACVLHPLKLQPSNYEIRLKDGSIIRANGVEEGKGKTIILKEVSGIDVSITEDEIAQFRAGPAKVQNLIDLPWTASMSAQAAVSKSAPAVSDQSHPVECWEGNNQEQIMAVASGLTLNFALPGKFRAVAMRVALLPDAVLNAQASIRILADGKEINRTSAFRPGDQPQFVEVSIPGSRTVSLVLSSFSPDAKLMFIDPVAIRE
ncbi:MAG: hypothetical protein PHD76_12510 [Methylacidiphilales bacterium]|nr:hypothetical protein [Candidatus Methylacidiphilales bacterium]